MHYDELPGGMRSDRDYEEPDDPPEADTAAFKRGLRFACMLCAPFWLIVALIAWALW